MDLELFRAEAKSLARPCKILRDSGRGAPSAYWHGFDEGPVCISLSHNGGWLNVHFDEDYEDEEHVELAERPLVSDRPLFAESSISLPPVDAVFLYGSDSIGDFLRRHDWPRSEPFNDNFPDPVPGKYESIWQDHHPLYRRDIAAVVGGWHLPWPDGDWYDYADHSLVVFTLLEAEPWIEVFQLGDEYVVRQRIT